MNPLCSYSCDTVCFIILLNATVSIPWGFTTAQKNKSTNITGLWTKSAHRDSTNTILRTVSCCVYTMNIYNFYPQCNNNLFIYIAQLTSLKMTRELFYWCFLLIVISFAFTVKRKKWFCPDMLLYTRKYGKQSWSIFIEPRVTNFKKVLVTLLFRSEEFLCSNTKRNIQSDLFSSVNNDIKRNPKYSKTLNLVGLQLLSFIKIGQNINHIYSYTYFGGRCNSQIRLQKKNVGFLDT